MNDKQRREFLYAGRPDYDKSVRVNGEGLPAYSARKLREVFADGALESSERRAGTKTVLEVAVPFDYSRSVATYAFRRHGGAALMLEALSERPTTNLQDGTSYASSSAVHLYTSCFSTYAIGSAGYQRGHPAELRPHEIDRTFGSGVRKEARKTNPRERIRWK